MITVYAINFYLYMVCCFQFKMQVLHYNNIMLYCAAYNFGIRNICIGYIYIYVYSSIMFTSILTFIQICVFFFFVSLQYHIPDFFLYRLITIH